MPEYIRVRWNSGTEQTIVKPHAYAQGEFEVLKDSPVDENGDPLPPSAPSAPTYEDQKVGDLKAEIAQRNQGRDEADQIPAAGNKPDLIAALTADDNKES